MLIFLIIILLEVVNNTVSSMNANIWSHFLKHAVSTQGIFENCSSARKDFELVENVVMAVALMSLDASGGGMERVSAISEKLVVHLDHTAEFVLVTRSLDFIGL
ncbi:hypothetical protein SK128_020927, partial [Halocaridina rubra]